jgi:hypothetical protein
MTTPYSQSKVWVFPTASNFMVCLWIFIGAVYSAPCSLMRLTSSRKLSPVFREFFNLHWTGHIH